MQNVTLIGIDLGKHSFHIHIHIQDQSINQSINQSIKQGTPAQKAHTH
ncbi:putative transposase [Yersinia wautersii]|uniref:Transposase n=1 Tax=Yersinia wautersii TaxID=1341643 RepID=A0ABM9TCT5_9GAMM|nr:putative transposase [Yersinia wautersii]